MTVIAYDFAAAARARKVRLLIAALRKYAEAQGPCDDAALFAAAQLLDDVSWPLLETIAGVRKASETTRQLVLDELESRLNPETETSTQHNR